MIDIHTHILPGLDDGAGNKDESLAMARIALEDGIHTIVATPHVLPGVFDNDKNKILSITAELNQALQEQKIAVNILPGAEYRLEPGLPRKLSQGELLTINNNDRYLLVELPSAFIPEYTAQVLYEIQLQGVTPIIAHPERNGGFSARPAALQELVARGMLTQITSASITGSFGKNIKQIAWGLLKQGMAHLISSDAHSSTGRAPLLSEAQKEIQKHLGSKPAWQLIQQNPGLVIEGKPLEKPYISGNNGWWKQLIKRA